MQLVGPKGPPLDTVSRSFLLHPEWLLHILGQLCLSNWCHDLHTPGLSSPR
jgi:hypothetical protein